MQPHRCFLLVLLLSWTRPGVARKQDQDDQDEDGSWKARKSARMRKAVLDVEKSFEQVVKKDLHNLGEKLIAKMEKEADQDKAHFEDSEIKRQQHSLDSDLANLGHHRGLPTPPPKVAIGVEDNMNEDDDDPDTEDPKADVSNMQSGSSVDASSLIESLSASSPTPLARKDRVFAEKVAKSSDRIMRREGAAFEKQLLGKIFPMSDFQAEQMLLREQALEATEAAGGDSIPASLLELQDSMVSMTTPPPFNGTENIRTMNDEQLESFRDYFNSLANELQQKAHDLEADTKEAEIEQAHVNHAQNLKPTASPDWPLEWKKDQTFKGDGIFHVPTVPPPPDMTGFQEPFR